MEDQQIKKALKVIRKYSKAIKKKPAFELAQEWKLPYDKHTIKDSIKLIIKCRKVPEMDDFLKSGYIMLSEWQDIFTPIGFGDSNTVRAAMSIIEKGMQSRVNSEREKLYQEITDFVNEVNKGCREK
ncbi:hypothetical protein LNTAR_15122 [Lentisphaera araneosa HTCC2155]|uniref:Uncharacterized protein n=1 Tax=Lentisphaera araneosa HTCC2155 TaxID=313628 RepID=A6DRE9_9BACT|nr:hypothetical protein [Lentisphaera araneosa]EDM25759.1 hypothetical protein LNTAR_15122 [Lentisphaera araneosa HTCC2155]